MRSPSRESSVTRRESAYSAPFFQVVDGSSFRRAASQRGAGASTWRASAMWFSGVDTTGEAPARGKPSYYHSPAALGSSRAEGAEDPTLRADFRAPEP